MANFAICSNQVCMQFLDLRNCAVSDFVLRCARCDSQMYCRCPFCHMPFAKRPRFWRPTECQFCGIEPRKFGMGSLADSIPAKRFDVFTPLQPRNPANFFPHRIQIGHQH